MSVGGIVLNGIITVPFWLNQLALHRAGILHDINMRNAGFEIGHYFRTSQWEWYILWLVISFVLLWIARKKKETGTALFLTLLFSALFVCLNMQVVIGVNIHPDHWMSKVHILPLAWAVSYLVSLVMRIAAERHWLRPVFMYGVVTVLVTGALLGFVQEKIHIAHAHITQPPMSKDLWNTLSFMSTQLPEDSVVLTPSVEASVYQTIYTPTRSYLSHGLSTLAPENEVLERLYAAYHFLGVSESYLHQAFISGSMAQVNYSLVINENDFFLERQLYWLKFRSREFDGSLQGYKKSGRISDQEIERVVREYRDFSGDIISLRKKYRVDYVLSTDFDQAIGTVDLSTSPYLEEIFQSGNVRLYQFRDAPLVSLPTIR